MNPMDIESLRAKIRWEGGVLETLEYGIAADDIEDAEVAAAWREAEVLWTALREKLPAIDGLIKARYTAWLTNEG